VDPCCSSLCVPCGFAVCLFIQGINDLVRFCLDVVVFNSIHVCWCGLGWNLVQVPFQSTSIHVD